MLQCWWKSPAISVQRVQLPCFCLHWNERIATTTLTFYGLRFVIVIKVKTDYVTSSYFLFCFMFRWACSFLIAVRWLQTLCSLLWIPRAFGFLVTNSAFSEVLHRFVLKLSIQKNMLIVHCCSFISLLNYISNPVVVNFSARFQRDLYISYKGSTISAKNMVTYSCSFN